MQRRVCSRVDHKLTTPTYICTLYVNSYAKQVFVRTYECNIQNVCYILIDKLLMCVQIIPADKILILYLTPM